MAYLKFFLLIFLLVWYGFFLAYKIDLTTADLGRHLKNGQLFFESLTKKEDFRFLKTNFYSYTFADYPFLNHHWGSGVIFFLLEKVAGFSGLSLFYIVFSLITFLLFFRIAQKEAGFKIACLFALLLIPLMAERREIRPEIFSYFFSAIFLWLLWNYKKGSISYYWLFLLPALEIFWVNTHIYFFLGPIFIGIFLFEKLIFFLKSRGQKAVDNKFSFRNFSNSEMNKIEKKAIKKLSLIFLLTIFAAFLNPFGISGVLYPLNIFKNYGYLIVENQSIGFLERLGIIQNPNFLLFKITFAILVLSFILIAIFKPHSFSISYFCLGTVFSIMALFAIRNFTLFGFFVLPILAWNIKNLLPSETKFEPIEANLAFAFFIFLIFAFIIFNHYQFLISRLNNFGLGLVADNNKAAEFLKKENIQGPILNNYDIGGYLIYHLYPKEFIFVDNRPEAYPISFFQEIYIPLQENKAVWKEQVEKYNFNVIFFSHRDATPWGQKFLIDRVNDPDWPAVFADRYAIIFLKRNDLNQPIIEKYQIPKEYFRVIPLK